MDPSTIAITEAALTQEGGFPSSQSNNYESGIEKIQEMFANIAPTSSENLSVASVGKSESPMDMLKGAVSDFIDKEIELEVDLKSMSTVSSSILDSKEAYQTFTKSMFEMQIAFQEKSLNGAMLLSTGKSAEGFVKTLMKSQ